MLYVDIEVTKNNYTKGNLFNIIFPKTDGMEFDLNFFFVKFSVRFQFINLGKYYDFFNLKKLPIKIQNSCINMNTMLIGPLAMIQKEIWSNFNSNSNYQARTDEYITVLKQNKIFSEKTDDFKVNR